RDLANDLFILDQQHGRWLHRYGLPGLRPRLRNRHLLTRLGLDVRQIEMYRGACADGALQPHDAARLPDEAIELTEPEPSSLSVRLRGEKRFEGMRQHVG